MTRRFFLTISVVATIFVGMVALVAATAHAATDQNSVVVQLTVLNPVSSSTYSVTIVKNGTGSGTVTSADGGIVCGATCSESNIPNASSTVLTATPDPGSTFIGWSGSGSGPGCSGVGICTVATSSVIIATFDLIPVTPPPSAPPSNPPVNYPSGPSEFIFEGFSTDISTTSAVINWYTTQPSVSSISWGLNSDGAGGSGSETTYNSWHSIELDNLSPDTGYVLTIRATSQSGAVIYDTYYFRTLPITNAIPLNVTDFTGQVSFGGNILLSWVNPFEPDFSSVVVTRGTRFFPRDPSEGYLVYQGPEEEALDTHVVAGQDYYYSAFVTNTEGAHSSGTLLKYGIPFSSETPATSTPIFGGGIIPVATSTIASIFSLIQFIQNNISIPEINSTVSVSASLPILIEIPANDVPLNTEETTIVIEEGSGAQTFIFQKLDDGSLRVLVPTILSSGKNLFTIDFLQLGSEVQINGTFLTSGQHPSEPSVGIFAYLFETYVSNNFLCTTLPIMLMFFIFMAMLVVVILMVKGDRLS
jgi:hypothetical protein